MFKRSLLVAALACTTTIVQAQDMGTYRVTITNLTLAQSFTPQLVAVHNRTTRMFKLGMPASSGLEVLAEGGDTSPLAMELEAKNATVTTIPGLLGPGQTVSVRINGRPGLDVLSIAAMLIPTNDTFVAAQALEFPATGRVSVELPAYDSGTEENDQSCASMPGPRCGGEGVSAPAEGDEGFVYIGNGFHELSNPDANGDEVLGPLRYDWRNPVALVSIRRIN